MFLTGASPETKEVFCFEAASHSQSISAMVKSRYIGDGHPTFNRNPYNGYINPYYWVDDHPLLYGNNGSLDPSTFVEKESPQPAISAKTTPVGYFPAESSIIKVTKI